MLLDFLRETRAAALGEEDREIVVYLGNEAGDLDSVVSAVVAARHQLGGYAPRPSPSSSRSSL